MLLNCVGAPCARVGSQELGVPTLFRLLLVLSALAALVYGGMTAMVTYMTPQPHQISQPINLPGSRH
jgi:hypothetical protein